MNFSNWTGIVFTKLSHWGIAMIAMLPNIILAAVVLVAFVFFSKFIKNITYKILLKFSKKESISRLFSAVASLLFMIIGLFIALKILNLNQAVSTLLAGAGIIGLALGFAFQGPYGQFHLRNFHDFQTPV